ncbi:MAG: dTMP kinase [Clostridia bacterium]|nr:dTMP kinase [Clostridia bacterium]
MRFQYYLFDLDGTLTQSEEGITRSVAHALSTLGHPVPEMAVLKRFIGPPLLDSFQRITGLTPDEAAEAVRIYRERYAVVGWKENRVYAGIPRLLRSLKKHGAYVALASSKPEESCRKILDYFALTPLFDAISAPDWSEKHADKAKLVRSALPAGADPKRACMVGDRMFDMQGAKANEVVAIGALYGYGSREELLESGADQVFETVSDMTDWMLDGDSVARGAFLSLEGSDGSGKTTQLKLLVDYLERTGNDPVITREPGGTPIAEQIRQVILTVKNAGMSDACEALLYAASRAEHADKVIAPAVEAGRMVLSDRYVDSSIAYQGHGRELSGDFVRQINAWAMSRVMPDATIYLDMNPDAALKRRCAASEPDRMESEASDFFRRVYDGYDALRRAEPERFLSVDADQSPEDVHADVQAAVRTALKRLDAAPTR